MTCNLLVSGNGCFYTATINDELVGYACFSFGCHNPDLRRLYYIAVPGHLQGKGLGAKVLKSIIKSELPTPNGSLTVACQSSLTGFYEKQGFTNTGSCVDFYAPNQIAIKLPGANQERDEVLTYSNNPSRSPDSIIAEQVFIINVDMDDLVACIPSMEANFNIELSSDLPPSIALKIKAK